MCCCYYKNVIFISVIEADYESTRNQLQELKIQADDEGSSNMET